MQFILGGPSRLNLWLPWLLITFTNPIYCYITRNNNLNLVPGLNIDSPVKVEPNRKCARGRKKRKKWLPFCDVNGCRCLTVCCTNCWEQQWSAHPIRICTNVLSSASFFLGQTLSLGKELDNMRVLLSLWHLESGHNSCLLQTFLRFPWVLCNLIAAYFKSLKMLCCGCSDMQLNGKWHFVFP